MAHHQCGANKTRKETCSILCEHYRLLYGTGYFVKPGIRVRIIHYSEMRSVIDKHLLREKTIASVQ